MEQQNSNLQTAYSQALGQRTPDWAIQISNAMPSIAEIIAAGTTKNAFNQGKIADSLERQKDRQIAYNQWLKENEGKTVNDYVQMAKDQLAIDMAQDDREYKKTTDQINREIQEKLADRAYQQWLDEFKYKQDKDKKDFDEDVRKFNETMDRLKDKDWYEYRDSDRNYDLNKRKVELAEKEAEKAANSVGVDTTKFDDRQKALLTLLDQERKEGKISAEDYIANVNNLATTGQLLEKKSKKSPLASLTDFSTQVTEALKPNKSTYKGVTITKIGE